MPIVLWKQTTMMPTYQRQVAKTDAIKETDASEQKKAQKDKKYVLEDDDSLKVTVTDVDVSGKTFKQVKKEMQEEAKKNGGVIGEKE